jgi:hypothetical protein
MVTDDAKEDNRGVVGFTAAVEGVDDVAAAAVGVPGPGTYGV